MKFSIVVPVYNVELYLRKCIDSIINQTYKDYELLIINDGTKDNSQAIIDEYVKQYPEYVKSFIKENGGLSDARNYGIQRSNGEYLVFVDSDDFIEPKLLEKLNNEIEKNNNVDVIGYHTEIFDKDYNLYEVLKKPVFSNLNGEEALVNLIKNAKLFETAWGYCYRADFWKKNEFKYAKGLLHEDLGLTPEIMLKAKSVSVIDYDAYGYYQSENSIMRSGSINYEKEYKKTLDLVQHFDRFYEILENNQFNKNAKKELYNYLVSSILWKFNVLPEQYNIKLAKIVKEKNIAKYKINKTIREKKDFFLLRLKYKF